MGLTTDQHDGCLHEILPNGQQQCYLILPDGERKNLVRPVRKSYQHVGPAFFGELRSLTPEEKERYSNVGYVKFEAYGPERAPVIGRFWTQADLDRVGRCGAVTTMGAAIAETYAAQPDFYTGTFCVACGKHYPVGAEGEFVWLDGSKVGT